MVDFIEAFKQGQTVAERVKNNNQEIDSVFKRLNAEITKASENKVQLSIEHIPYSAWVINENGDTECEEEHDAICASNLGFLNIQELAEWEKGKEGYPCKITIGNKQHYCEDKTELEETVALMLQDPIVAGILADVMRLSEKQAA
jgi:hypothetical protein